ncbi:G-box-binding factor 4 [Hibiscus syriacus]|uniref:G-box-binding factor 4 n=1 Tax=Hibiscus syriacus TaxID=106335 RepID=A0A6A3CTI1_HIBSY|nr:G-box-binding factor 4 [Hibiscus syriacus]
MASSTSNSRNSDLSRRFTTSSTKPQLFTDQNKNDDSNRLSSTMTVEGILRNVYSTAPSTETALVDASITLIDAPIPNNVVDNSDASQVQGVPDYNNNVTRSVDEVWREIVSGERKEIAMKEEAPDEMMTLEDFLAKAGAVEDTATAEVKLHPDRLSGGVYTFDPMGSGGGAGGRRKRGRGVLMEPLDKAAQQRQRRMIKNRESAARSRERKQAYQVELESLAVKLEEENEWLLKEKAERTKERFKQLMEKVVPVVELRRTPRVLRRVRSLQW